MSNKILLFSILLSVFITDSMGQTCDEKGRMRIDGTYAKLLTVGGSGRKFPENKQGQLKKFCRNSSQYIKEADMYKDKCLSQMPKQVTGVLVYSVRNFITQLCKKDSKRLDELIASTPCANSAKSGIDKCYTKLIDNFLGAFNAKDSMKIPHICCDYVKFLECSEKSVQGNKKCQAQHIDVALNFIRQLFGNIVDLICGDYTEGSDKCDKIAQTPKKNKIQKRTKSFMLPLIDAIASL